LKRRSGAILLVGIVSLATAGAVIYWKRGSRGSAADSRSTTTKVTRRTFSSSVLATGSVKPQVGAEVRVGARISGKVDRLHANIGDVVKKGQVIAELEKADLAAKVAQRTAELRMTEARLSAIRSLRPHEIERTAAEVSLWLPTVALNRKEVTRQKDLLKQGFTSSEAFDRAKEQLAVSEARQAVAQKALALAKIGFDEDVKLVLAEVERAKAALAEGQVQLSYATITAPIAGIVASVSTQEGETVAAGLNAPTFVTIIDLDRLQVDAFVDEVDIGKVLVGQRVVFTVDAFPAREFEGKVAAIYPKAILQENVVNYDVVVEIASDYDGLLRPDMTASVTIFLEKRDQVLAIPTKAVRRERGKNVAYVVADDNVPQSREIKVGWRDGAWVEVAQGLNEGETVLLEPPASPSRSEVRE